LKPFQGADALKLTQRPERHALNRTFIDDLDVMVVRMLHATTLHLARNGYNISIDDLSVLLHCYAEADPQTAQTVTKRLRLDPLLVAQALNDLCDRDLLRFRRNPLDRRTVLAYQTARGHAFMELLHRDFGVIADELDVLV
jgi:DNA-binding MarR family transcriptional regulator